MLDLSPITRTRVHQRPNQGDPHDGVVVAGDRLPRPPHLEAGLMAMAPPRPCGNPRCGKLNCQDHRVEAWRTRDRPTVTRIRGRKLQRLREQLFARQRNCVRCLKDGRETRATIRDHIIPIAEGGTEDASNIQALCLDCSDRKTEGESLRGIRASSLTPRFRKSSTPRGLAGQFRTRRR